MNSVNANLAEAVELRYPGFSEQLWTTVGEVINLQECEVYSYLPDLDSDPLSDGILWSFNYFFYNKAQKKILYFTCAIRRCGVFFFYFFFLQKSGSTLLSTCDPIGVRSSKNVIIQQQEKERKNKEEEEEMFYCFHS